MKGDNAKTINPDTRTERARKQRSRVANAVSQLDIQLDAARSGTHKKREDALRRMLSTLLLCLPQDAGQDRKDRLGAAFLESSFVEDDEFFDMPNVSVDGDMISIHGNFSIRKLARKLSW